MSRLQAALELRPIDPTDLACLSDAWARSSGESRHRRMNGTLAELQPSALRYFTDVDHYHHEAMVAIDTDSGRLVGVMRYIRIPGSAAEAELAALVVDEYQHRGVATALLAQLSSRALASGVKRYRAIVAPENAPAVAALRRVGATEQWRDGELEFLLPVAGTIRALR